MLKAKTSGDLKNARIARRRNSPELAGINLTETAGILKLSMIKNVKSLKSKLKQFRFRELDVFRQSHVPVIETRAR
jgi:hypothetical protein